MPRPLIRAMGLVKQSAAEVNAELGNITEEVGAAIPKRVNAPHSESGCHVPTYRSC